MFPRLWRVVVLCGMLAALVPMVTVTASADTGGRLTVSPGYALPGERVQVTGATGISVVRPVRLQRKTSTGWVTLKSGTTTRTGAFAFKIDAPLKPLTAWTLRGFAPATTVNGRHFRYLVTPTARLRVAQPTSEIDAPDDVLVGAGFRVDAVQDPIREAQAVLLQRLVNDTWVNVATDLPNRNGEVTFLVGALPEGAWSLRTVATAYHGAPAIKHTPFVVNVGRWTALESGADRENCGIMTSHNLYCWPTTETTVSPARQIAGKWNQVSLGYRTICGIKTDGSAWCWGSNEYGRLGDGTTKDESSRPVRVISDSGWRDIESSWRHTCGIKVDGTQWCWGYGSGSVPVQRGVGTSWTDLEGGYHYTCGLTADHGLGCDQVVNYADPSAAPAPVPPAGTWVDLAALVDTACGLKDDGTIWCGPTASEQQLGNDTDWVQIGGSSHLCAIKSDATLWCSVGPGGHNYHPAAMEKISADTDWVTATDGGQNGCATKTDGSGWCWVPATDGSRQLTRLRFVV